MTPHDAIHTTCTPVADVSDTRRAADFIGEAQFALLGEASHGTHEFYANRAHITRQLIVESGFRAVVAEADWPDAYRVNRYVRHESVIKPRLEQVIGVIYRPETERQSHYFAASLSSQFDAVLHFDHTSAVRPLEISAGWTQLEVPETFPTGV
jgi:erythromycin esterase-like protein